MKLNILTIFFLSLTYYEPTQTQNHVIHKRFLWNSLAKLAQPFIRRPRPQPPPQNPPYYNNPYPAPPVFQVAPTAPQPVRVPPSSGQLYLPLPGQNYQQNVPPVYVPPSSYGAPAYPQPPADAQWRPMATQADGGPLYYGGVGAPVGPPSFNFPGQPGGVTNVNIGSGFPLSGVEVANLVSDPFRGSSVFLSASDRATPDGFIKVALPSTILHSIVGLGLDEPTVYLASSSIAPSQDFALLDVNNETIESLRAIAQQPNSSRAAEMPSTASEDLVMAIKKAAPRLAGNATTVDFDDVLSSGGLSFDLSDVDLGTDTTDATDVTKAVEEPETEAPATVSSISSELPAVFLASRDADVPSDYIRVLLPDDILKELRRRVGLKTLNSQSVLRRDLTEAYLAPGTSSAVRPPKGLVPVQLSREALQVLNDYANEAEKLQNSNDEGPKLELPRTVLEQLSKDSSQRVRLINGGRETVVKTGSTDVFIAPSDQKPPDGYVSIPLTENAMNELKKNFLGGSIRSHAEKGIPVRAYIAPADKKLPAGHVAVPLPDSILESVRAASGTSGRSISKVTASDKGSQGSAVENSVLRESDTSVFLAPSRKQAPSSFRKLKLPETIMEDMRQAIPAAKLAEAGTPAKDLTAAYLASSNEFVPPGFLSIAVPDTLVKMLEAFTETRDAKEIEDDIEETISSGKSTDKKKSKNAGTSRDLGVEESPNLSRKIIDALLEATGRTVSQVFKNARGEARNRGRNRGRGSTGRGRGSASRDNARITSADAEENDFDRDDVEDNIDIYQPQYQMSPFFPASVSSYPYVDPYQYSGLWTYGDGNQWNGDGTQLYGEYVGADGNAQNRDAYYIEPYQDGSQASSVQYEIGQPQYEMSTIKKREGEVSKSTSR